MVPLALMKKIQSRGRIYTRGPSIRTPTALSSFPLCAQGFPRDVLRPNSVWPHLCLASSHSALAHSSDGLLHYFSNRSSLLLPQGLSLLRLSTWRVTWLPPSLPSGSVQMSFLEEEAFPTTPSKITALPLTTPFIALTLLDFSPAWSWHLTQDSHIGLLSVFPC